jgi:hypothetical protein
MCRNGLYRFNGNTLTLQRGLLGMPAVVLVMLHHFKIPNVVMSGVMVFVMDRPDSRIKKL